MTEKAASGARVEVEFRTGIGFRFYSARFDWRRWRGNHARGTCGPADGRRHTLRVYQFPFGIVHVLGRWTSE